MTDSAIFNSEINQTIQNDSALIKADDQAAGSLDVPADLAKAKEPEILEPGSPMSNKDNQEREELKPADLEGI